MGHISLSTLMLTVMVAMSSCGMEPSGGDGKVANKNSSETQTNVKEPIQKDETSAVNSADALPSGIAKLSEDYASLNTKDVSACHVAGKVFNRRTLKCSNTISLGKSFECTTNGITDAFILTGYQIDAVLTSAKNDGFVIDQCGETDEGLRLVFFLRANDDSTFSIREIETSTK